MPPDAENRKQGVIFAIESFRRHMDSGRWLFQQGMEEQGYLSAGGSMPPPGIACDDVAALVDAWNAPVAIMWPRYEWDPALWKGAPLPRDACFRNIGELAARDDVLRVAVLHDAGSERESQRAWHEEFRPHVYLCWYHERSVMALAPHVPRERIVRTYHVIQGRDVPQVCPRRGVGVVSGARNHEIYPFRTAAIEAAESGPLGFTVHYLKHPGYHQKGAQSAGYIHFLSRYRVAICSASVYGFALKKHIEATAAGCRVITDLPNYDCLPGIDGNFLRVSPNITMRELHDIVEALAADWDLERQQAYARAAVQRYDYLFECARLAKELAAQSHRLAKCPALAMPQRAPAPVKAVEIEPTEPTLALQELRSLFESTPAGPPPLSNEQSEEERAEESYEQLVQAYEAWQAATGRLEAALGRIGSGVSVKEHAALEAARASIDGIRSIGFVEGWRAHGRNAEKGQQA